MTDQAETIQETDVADTTESIVDHVENQESSEVQEQEADAQRPETSYENDAEFPKKAVNAINRKNKQINKLRAQMRELEAKLSKEPEVKKQQEVNPDDFENYNDYVNAQVEALVEQRIMQSQADMQKQQLTQQQEALQAQRDKYIVEQAKEVSQTFTDLPQVWQQNVQLLDALPKEIADIFYSIDNAPAAVYTLAKEGKLESLLHANPYVAASEILDAQRKGLEQLSKPRTQMSQAPQPITKARGTGSVKKSIKQMSGRELLDKFAK